MNHSGDAAEQIVRISLEGMEYALRITGTGAKNIAAFLVAAVKSDSTDNKLKLRGKERLTNMLKCGKEMKIFAIKNSELERFAKEAKKYGVVYCALKDKNSTPDRLLDIMAKAEDASKISRIMDRLQLAIVDRAAIESQAAERDKDTLDSQDTDKLLDLLLDADGKARKDEPVIDTVLEEQENPTQAGTAENRQSVSRSKMPPISTADIRVTKKPESVKAFLQERTAQNLKNREKQQPKLTAPEVKLKETPKPILHQQPHKRSKKYKKSKER